MTYTKGNKKCMCGHGRRKHNEKGCKLCKCVRWYPGIKEAQP